MSTKPVQEHIPFWYPGSPVMAGRHGMSLMWPGPINREAYDLYVETWNAHKGDTARMDGPNSVPKVGCTMMLSVAPTEAEAIDVATRGVNGLMRRANAVHQWDVEVLGEQGAEAALHPCDGSPPTSMTRFPLEREPHRRSPTASVRFSKRV